MTSRGNWEPPGKNQNPATDRNAPQPAGTLRRQFRECVNRLTGHSPAPQPKPRRRRTGDTGRAFKVTAMRIMRRTVRLPVMAYAVASMWDTLDWLNPWECNDTFSTNEFGNGFHHTEPHDLSPHL